MGRQRPGGHVGQAGFLQHRTHARPQRPPDIGQRGGRAGIGQITEPDIAHAGQRAVDAAQHVGDADLGGRPGQLVAALTAAAAVDQSIGTQIGQDVDQKLRRDALRLGQVVGLDQRALVGRGQLDHRPDRVLRLGRHPHAANSALTSRTAGRSGRRIPAGGVAAGLGSRQRDADLDVVTARPAARDNVRCDRSASTWSQTVRNSRSISALSLVDIAMTTQRSTVTAATGTACSPGSSRRRRGTTQTSACSAGQRRRAEQRSVQAT